MYLQAVANFSVRDSGQTHTILAASKCCGAVAFTNNSIEIQGRAPELASSSTSQILQRNYKIGVSDTAGGNSWL
jgi:hypothetical protein